MFFRTENPSLIFLGFPEVVGIMKIIIDCAHTFPVTLIAYYSKTNHNVHLRMGRSDRWLRLAVSPWRDSSWTVRGTSAPPDSSR